MIKLANFISIPKCYLPYEISTWVARTRVGLINKTFSNDHIWNRADCRQCTNLSHIKRVSDDFFLFRAKYLFHARNCIWNIKLRFNMYKWSWMQVYFTGSDWIDLISALPFQFYQFICALFILFVVTFFFILSCARSLSRSIASVQSSTKKKENFLCVLSQRGEMNNNKDSVKQLIFIVSVASLYWYVLGCCCNFFFMLVLFFFVK